MMPSIRFTGVLFIAWLLPVAAHATKPKLDKDTCTQLRLEQTQFLKAGVAKDISKGPEWAKTNLSADRVREIARYIKLDEEVRFGCRDAKLSADAEKASKAAARIELNSDADPIAPVVKDPAKPGAKDHGKPAADAKPVPKTVPHKKAKATEKSSSLRPRRAPTSLSQAVSAFAREGNSGGSGTASGATATDGASSQPILGFGETIVLPYESP
jgi:hypothetical protein